MVLIEQMWYDYQMIHIYDGSAMKAYIFSEFSASALLSYFNYFLALVA